MQLTQAVLDALRGTVGAPSNNNRYVTAADLATHVLFPFAPAEPPGEDDGWWVTTDGAMVTLAARVGGVVVTVAEVEIPT